MPWKILVVGNLNVDYISTEGLFRQEEPRVGGTAYHCARAFKNAGLVPCILGSVGDDARGKRIHRCLEEEGIESHLRVDPHRATGTCHITFDGLTGSRLRLMRNHGDANDWRLDELDEALRELGTRRFDMVFLSCHVFAHHNCDYAARFFDSLERCATGLVVDIVPHTLYERMTLDDFKKALRNKATLMIAELKTLMRFIDPKSSPMEPSDEHWAMISQHFDTPMIVLRYGYGEIEMQEIRKRSVDCEMVALQLAMSTGYSQLTQLEERCGFGDRLTADLLVQYAEQIIDVN